MGGPFMGPGPHASALMGRTLYGTGPLWGDPLRVRALMGGPFMGPGPYGETLYGPGPLWGDHIHKGNRDPAKANWETQGSNGSHFGPGALLGAGDQSGSIFGPQVTFF